MVSAKHTAIYLSSSFLKRLAQPRSWPSVGSVVRVSNARMKMILHTTTLSSPLLCFYSASPTLTVPHFGFKTWPVCVCLWWGRVLCFSAAQCESTVRSLTHSWAWSRPARPDGKGAHRRASSPHLLRASVGPSLSDKSDMNSYILGLFFNNVMTMSIKVHSWLFTEHYVP